MTANDKLAVLIPVYNGGDGLLRSVASCALSALPGDRYELIVVDNCSTDSAVSSLPAYNGKGAPIHVFANQTNIGRVANWNRALEIALERNFRYVTFLFAGDCWLPGTAIPEMLDLLLEANAAIAFAPFVVARADGSKRVSQRFHVAGSVMILDSESFLGTLLNSGLFPLGPLQANLYRIDALSRPVFDPANPTRTDVEATLDFVQASRSAVILGSTPFLEWREHAGRFHMSMGIGSTIQDYMATFQRACARASTPVNYGAAKSRVVLNSLRLMVESAPPRQWPYLLAVIARCAFRTPYRMNPVDLVRTLWARFALGRRLLQFG